MTKVLSFVKSLFKQIQIDPRDDFAFDQRISIHGNLEHPWLHKLDLAVDAEKSGNCCLSYLLQLLLREPRFWVGAVLVPEPVTLFQLFELLPYDALEQRD